jgi:hypothetical protein
MRLNYSPLISIAVFIIVSCYSDNTTDKEEVFEYWLGIEPPPEVKLIRGEYYQSPHFTLEYELFLEMKVKKVWWEDFVKENDLTKVDNEQIQTVSPSWFQPDLNFKSYSSKKVHDYSRYFVNEATGHTFVYETLGM